MSSHLQSHSHQPNPHPNPPTTHKSSSSSKHHHSHDHRRHHQQQQPHRFLLIRTSSSSIPTQSQYNNNHNPAASSSFFFPSSTTSSYNYQEPVLIEDEDLMFDGKPLNELYEKNRFEEELRSRRSSGESERSFGVTPDDENGSLRAMQRWMWREEEMTRGRGREKKWTVNSDGHWQSKLCGTGIIKRRLLRRSGEEWDTRLEDGTLWLYLWISERRLVRFVSWSLWARVLEFFKGLEERTRCVL